VEEKLKGGFEGYRVSWTVMEVELRVRGFGVLQSHGLVCLHSWIAMEEEREKGGGGGRGRGKEFGSHGLLWREVGVRGSEDLHSHGLVCLQSWIAMEERLGEDARVMKLLKMQNAGETNFKFPAKFLQPSEVPDASETSILESVMDTVPPPPPGPTHALTLCHYGVGVRYVIAFQSTIQKNPLDQCGGARPLRSERSRVRFLEQNSNFHSENSMGRAT
jgi:hypothetical protein